MRICITGATGLFGAHVAREPLRAGLTVRCTRRGNAVHPGLADEPIEWVPGDLGDQSALDKAFADCDSVLHCAGDISHWPTHAARVHAVNVIGTTRVIQAVRTAGVGRLVHCSTVDAIGLPPDFDAPPSTEDAPWNWDELGVANQYARTKYDAQRLVLEAARDIDAVVVNPAFLLGGLDTKGGSSRLILEVLRGRMVACPPGRNNFASVAAVARGMLLAREHGRRGACYILGGENLSYYEIVRRIQRVAGKSGPLLTLPAPMLRMAGKVSGLTGRLLGTSPDFNRATAAVACMNHTFSSALAVRELGYDPGDLDAAIAEGIAWFQSRGQAETDASYASSSAP